MALNHVDYGVLSTLQDVMENDYPVLIDTFLTDSDLRIEQMHHALLSQPFCLQELSMAAHSFKGSSSNMGAHRLASLCGQLEESSKGTAVVDVAALVHKIEREFAKVRLLFELERQRFNE